MKNIGKLKKLSLLHFFVAPVATYATAYVYAGACTNALKCFRFDVLIPSDNP